MITDLCVAYSIMCILFMLECISCACVAMIWVDEFEKNQKLLKHIDRYQSGDVESKRCENYRQSVSCRDELMQCWVVGLWLQGMRRLSPCHYCPLLAGPQEWMVTIDPLHLLVGCRKGRLNQAPSTSAASSDYWWRFGVKEGTLTQLL